MIIEKKADLSQLSTLKLGGNAKNRIILESPAEFFTLAKKFTDISWVARGSGSNILFLDGDREFILVEYNVGKKIKIISEDKDKGTIYASADVYLTQLINFMIKSGFGGLEELAGVPGKIGASVITNVGSHEQSLGAILQRVEIWSPVTGCAWIDGHDFSASYRSFKLRNDITWVFVLGVELCVPKNESNILRNIFKSKLAQKIQTQPLNKSSAGCVFKNPEGFSAGKLLDMSGFRGKRNGGMAFSEKHANFLINTGNGKASQALELIEEAQKIVFEKYAIKLALEIKVI